jgi:hypothetical protein
MVEQVHRASKETRNDVAVPIFRGEDVCSHHSGWRSRIPSQRGGSPHCLISSSDGIFSAPSANDFVSGCFGYEIADYFISSSMLIRDLLLRMQQV